MPRSSTRRKHYIWSSLLLLTVAACIFLLYITHVHKEFSNKPAVFSELLAAKSERLVGEECPQICITKECLYHANFLMTTMKPEVDPCDDFYSYACGKYNEKFGEDDVDSVKTRNHLKMVIAVKDVLDNMEPKPGTASWKLKAVYDSCMKADSENEALTEALKFLTELGIGPDWPFLAPDFQFENTSIATILGNLMAYNESPLMKIKYINAETSLNGEKSITIAINHLIFRERDQPIPVREMFMNILDEFELSSEESVTTNELWEEFLRIHMAVHMLLYKGRSSNWGDEYITLNCSEESKWKDTCEMFDAFIDKTTWSQKFNQSHAYISPYDIDFVSKIVPELKQFKDRDIANYLAIHFLWTHGMDLSVPFRIKSWKKSLEKEPFPPPHLSRWEYCVNWLAENMYIPLGHEFVKNILPKEAFDEVTVAVDTYAREIVNLIDEQDWIAERIREPVVARIRNLTSQIDLMKILFNETVINEAYKELNVSSENYFKNIMQHRLFSVKRDEELFKHDSEDMTPFEVQAHFAGFGIEILFGMLFPPFYSYRLERFINLITLGDVIAHEIGHWVYGGFYIYRDEAVYQSFADFKERVKCVVKQYSEFKFHSLDINLPGDRYKDETFSDMVAIATIDRMIEKYASSRLSLPGVPFTTEQLLYISSAQDWCSKSSAAEDEYYLTEKMHPPSRFRVIAQMQSSKNFAKAFNCSVGSYMNPENKCLAFD